MLTQEEKQARSEKTLFGDSLSVEACIDDVSLKSFLDFGWGSLKQS